MFKAKKLLRIQTYAYINVSRRLIPSLPLTYWGWVTHICVSKLTTNGSDNGLSPGRRQTIIWTNAEMSWIGSLGTNFNEILIEIYTLSLKKSRKWRSFYLGLNVLRCYGHVHNVPTLNVEIMEIIQPYESHILGRGPNAHFTDEPCWGIFISTRTQGYGG